MLSCSEFNVCMMKTLQLNARIARLAMSIITLVFALVSTVTFAQSKAIEGTESNDPEMIYPSPEVRQGKEAGTLDMTYVTTQNKSVVPDITDILEDAGNRSSDCWIDFDPNTWTEFPENDDGSLGPISLPFTFDLYGDQYTSVYLNNNGNLTFDNGYWWYSPSGFPITTPMIAPFWGDVDTRDASGEVWYYVTDHAFYVTWVEVGPYNAYGEYSENLYNSFQVVLTDGTDDVLEPGNNVGFFYGDMGWTTGSASSGVDGFGGYPATVGVNAGNGTDYIQIGLFSENNDDYDGPDGNEEGVNWLDDQCIELDVSSATNFPPVAQSFPDGNTVSYTEGGSTTIEVGFIGPESNETVSIAVDDLGNGGSTINTNTSGNPAMLNMTFSGLAAGTYTYEITGTDNNVSPESTTVTLTVTVEEPDFNCGDDITVTDTDDNCQEDVSITSPTAGSLVYGTEFDANFAVFDGYNDYIAVEDFYYQGFYDEHTVEAWIRTSDSGNQIISSFDRSEYWRLGINGNGAGSGEVSWCVNTNSGIKDMGSSTRVDDGLWHHVVGVYDNGDMYIYIDGVLDATDNRGTQMGDNTTRFGFVGTGSEASTYNGSRGPNDYFNGDIAIFRVWNRALSISEINETLCPDNTDIDLLIDYNFTQGSGTSIDDASAYNYDGQLYNSDASFWDSGNRPGCFSILNDFNNSSDASDTYPAGETTVTWTLADPTGTVATCSQLITITLSDPEMICENEYNDYIWKGTISDDWNTAGNWFDGEVPPTDANVTIDTDTYDPSIGSTMTLTNLLIKEGSTINFSSNFGNLRLKGDLAHNGDLVMDEGKFTFMGSGLQLIKGNEIPTFHDLRIDSEDSLRLMVDIKLTGAMMPDDGVFDWDGHAVTLLSDDTNTGSIGEIKSQAEILGDEITYNRYFPAASGSWRMICSPITNATFEQWNDDIPTTGFSGSDYPSYPSAEDPWSNVRVYNETVVEGDLHNGFESVNAITDVIGNSRGYFVYFIPSPTLIDLIGNFHKGDLTYTLTQTVSNTDPYNDGWNLIANPYPSAIDWDDELGWTKTDLDDAIYAFDPINEQYGSYINGISVGALDNQVASFQAFWVKASGPNPALTINEKAKVNTGGVFMRSQDMNTQSIVRVKVLTNDENKYDETVIGFHYGAEIGFDPHLDAYKFFSGDPALPNLATVPDTAVHHPMSITMVPVPEEDMVIDLLLRPGQNDVLTLKNILVDSYEGNLCFVLEDRELNTFHPFNLDDTYEFEVTEDMAEDRFAIHVSAPLDVTPLAESCDEAEDGTIVAQGFGDAPWTFTWYDEMGTVIREVEDMTTADTAEDLPPGFYEVIVTNQSEQCNTASRIVQVEAAPQETIEATSSVDNCNTSEDGTITFFASEDYTWDISLTNSEDGETINLEAITGDSTLTDLPFGVYTVDVVSNCGNAHDIENFDLRDHNAVFAEFGANSTNVSLNDGGSIYFFNSSSDNTSNVMWDFGDGSLDSLNFDPQHTFTEAGIYTVKLTAINGDCEDTTEMMVTITGIAPGTGNGQIEDMLGLTAEEVIQTEFEVIVTAENIRVTPEVAIDEAVVITVFLLNGQVAIDEQFGNLPEGGIDVNIGSLLPGLYTMSVTTEAEVLHSEEFAKQ